MGGTGLTSLPSPSDKDGDSAKANLSRERSAVRQNATIRDSLGDPSQSSEPHFEETGIFLTASVGTSGATRTSAFEGSPTRLT